MRKPLQCFLTVGLLLLTWLAVAQAGDYAYITNGSGITITGYTGPGGALTIPDQLPETNGLPVTRIGANAFYLCTNLTSVTIGNNVTNIGDHAFYFCENLASVTIGDSVTGIERFAFYYCSSVTNLTIGDGVTYIGSTAFRNCQSLTSLTIGQSVSTIGDYAFTACSYLPSLTIPGSVTTIGNNAFQHCTRMTNVTMPGSVTNIGTYAFYYCSSLTTFTVDTNNPAYSSLDGVLFNKSQTTLIQWPLAKASNYRVPDTVTTIGFRSFAWSGLTNLTITSGVTNIESEAFMVCNRLRGVYFTGNAPTVGGDPFLGANNVIVYYLPGTTNWGPSFGGRPTAPWQPQLLASEVTTDQFSFNIVWAGGMTFAVEACTNLANPAWLPIQTNTLTADTIYFSDPDWTNSPSRFYRVRWP